MAAHIGTVQSALRIQTSSDPLAQLRDALAPLHGKPGKAAKAGVATDTDTNTGTDTDSDTDSSSSPDEPSTYLGALT